MPSRRFLVLSGLASLIPAAPALSQLPQSSPTPLRVGADEALVASELLSTLRRGFAADTGLALTLVSGPVRTVLAALEGGELDVALSNAPELEARLEQQGLLHKRQPVASCGWALVGPAAKGRTGDRVALRGSRGIVEALTRLRDAAVEAPGTVSFVPSQDGSGTQTAEQALWRAARIAPQAPWYVAADPHRSTLAQARALGAHCLVERGAWAAQGGSPLAVLLDADPLLGGAVHVMRSFRSSHPAANLFVAWVGGPKGRRIVAAQPGYRVPTA